MSAATSSLLSSDLNSSRGEFPDHEPRCFKKLESDLEDLATGRTETIGWIKDVPVAFDHDCREGICGTCGVVINGQAHGPDSGTTTCQLHMRRFHDGDTIVIEPWLAKAFPIVRDLIVDRSAFDRIIQAGGFVSVNTGNAPEANTTLVPHHVQQDAMNAAACIGCGACVASCKNASAMLFVSAKVSHLASLPQGQAERSKRVLNMVATMDAEHFGNCTNTGECEAACPAKIKLTNIAQLNREYMKAALLSKE